MGSIHTIHGIPMAHFELTPSHIRPIVQLALEEDIGSGDVSAALIPAETRAEARVISREDAVICGRLWFDEVFQQLSHEVEIEWLVDEGAQVKPDQPIVQLHGPARALLSGERTALNFLQTLSGTATVTRRYVEALGDSKTRLLDTRKTLPGLRLAQKYAVRCGGGHNHRLGLHDMIMLKENHIAAAGGIQAAVQRARAQFPDLKVEVETETLQEVDAALQAGADIIMLDNFDIPTVCEALERIKGRALTELSGNVTLDTLPQLAKLGVDFISTGAITKHVRAIDLSMRIVNE
ncbi:nicotinate-nucleotide pyrophosphorylase [carboxylating] [Sulfurivirga caldicuralii]|uniref:Probable nicotinate-nucleotide pyrophosphorylase [carboxylating] n=1 Tax=Sulfurivirga caldicuralii TaxID=364032 RepID=A0A1N6EW41_9GAMM|nr:carboxylating nicotinate-nucleotide diphosphorylase [Sulfurivirga caldicuralii]SIN87279.1 nicotinate-nucleotide pyrophosphorylase [carboxylating] [Sulfurivirga caldicuralii]